MPAAAAAAPDEFPLLVVARAVISPLRGDESQAVRGQAVSRSGKPPDGGAHVVLLLLLLLVVAMAAAATAEPPQTAAPGGATALPGHAHPGLLELVHVEDLVPPADALLDVCQALDEGLERKLLAEVQPQVLLHVGRGEQVQAGAHHAALEEPLADLLALLFPEEVQDAVLVCPQQRLGLLVGDSRELVKRAGHQVLRLLEDDLALLRHLLCLICVVVPGCHRCC
mmetsp:Transcript_70301/g.194468  ORF Transcript_70301/g.194468 Transcript_70301/m.194468 type:complete len:225 (+) Transcript_70301:441-1115(+)